MLSQIWTFSFFHTIQTRALGLKGSSNSFGELNELNTEKILSYAVFLREKNHIIPNEKERKEEK